MRSEFKSSTQIYVSPIYFEIQLILGNDLFLHTRTWWPKSMKSEKLPEILHRVIFAFWIQICNPNLCKSHIFLNTANTGKWPFFCIPGPDDQNRWNRKNWPKFFHRVIFAFGIQICNPNLCKSHTFWNTADIEKCFFFRMMTKIDDIGKIALNSYIG